MDAIDREILELLRQDARISFTELGARVGLSANAGADRVRRLRRSGVIRGFVALVDEAADGTRLTVLVDVRLRPDVEADHFEAALRRWPAIVEAVHVTGGSDYQLRAVVRDAAQLDGLIRALKREAGAAETHTRLVLRTALDRCPR